MKPTLRQFEVFVAVAQAGSVSRAAENLGLSQSAMSNALMALEEQLDIQLFDRVGKSVHLNELGRQLLPRAADLVERANEIESMLHGRKGFGQIRVGAGLTIGNYLATLVVAAFLDRHSGCRVHLDVRRSPAIIDAVAALELDLGLIEGGCEHAELHAEPWIQDELTVFCTPDHPLADRPASAGDLAKLKWILREKGSNTRATFDRAMGRHLSKLDVRLELEHTEAIKRAVESSLGVGCLSRLALKEAFRRGSLKPIQTPSLNLTRQFHFVWHKQKYQTAGMRELIADFQRLTQGVSRTDKIHLPYIP